MSYTIKTAPNPLNIKEREKGSANKIAFSYFDSCIGIITKSGNTLSGIHLVMIDEKDKVFNEEDAQDVLKYVGTNYENSMIVGCISLWKSSVYKGFSALTKGLKSVEYDDRDSGYYSAEIINNQISIGYREK